MCVLLVDACAYLVLTANSLVWRSSKWVLAFSTKPWLMSVTRWPNVANFSDMVSSWASAGTEAYQVTRHWRKKKRAHKKSRISREEFKWRGTYLRMRLTPASARQLRGTVSYWLRVYLRTEEQRQVAFSLWRTRGAICFICLENVRPCASAPRRGDSSLYAPSSVKKHTC